MKGKLMKKASQEPVAIAGLFIAAVTVITAFIEVTELQQNALIIFATALGAFFARSKVSPI